MSENEGNTWKRDWEKGMTEIREQIAEMNRMYIKSSTEWEKRHAQMVEHQEQMVEHQEQMDKRQDRTQQKLDHITNLIGVIFDDLDDFGGQIENAGKSLRYKRNR